GGGAEHGAVGGELLTGDHDRADDRQQHDQEERDPALRHGCGASRASPSLSLASVSGASAVASSTLATSPARSSSSGAVGVTRRIPDGGVVSRRGRGAVGLALAPGGT